MKRRFAPTRCNGLALIACCLCVLVSDAHGCPACKEALAATSGNSMNLVRGFGWSIIFMMSTPFLIVGGLGSYFYVLVRQARKDTG